MLKKAASRNPTFGLRSTNATRASCDRGRLYDSQMKFLSNAYTNPNTNLKTPTPGILTLNDHHDDFESFSAPVFRDFIRNYFLSDSKTFGLLDTSFKKLKCVHLKQYKMSICVFWFLY